MRDEGSDGRGESGAVIVIALAFLVVVGVLAVAVVNMAWTGSKTLAVYREERVVRVNAESALQATVLRLSANPLMGTVDTPDIPGYVDTRDCPLNFPLSQDLVGGQVKPTFQAGSFLQVDCAPTSANNATGPWGGGGASGYRIDSGPDRGDQSPRDVTITVTCRRPSGSTNPLVCGSSGPARIVAVARVRFDIDYSISDRWRWATVPKIVNWDLRR